MVFKIVLKLNGFIVLLVVKFESFYKQRSLKIISKQMGIETLKERVSQYWMEFCATCIPKIISAL